MPSLGGLSEKSLSRPAFLFEYEIFRRTVKMRQELQTVGQIADCLKELQDLEERLKAIEEKLEVHGK